jgi:hypothetical protein
MKRILARSICSILIACLSLFPFGAYAGMVGTGQVVASAEAAGARDRLRDFIARSEIRQQLQSLGISGAAAQARVYALTDAEVASIVGRIDSLPAGGVSGAALLAGLIVVELIWYFWVR